MAKRASIRQDLSSGLESLSALKAPSISSSTFVGIGHSNKSMRAFLAELRSQGVTLVVDIRAKPQSRFFPRFNRGRLERSLNRAGIEYEWMGETLGNPKDNQGLRTLTGFKRHQTTVAYNKGVADLSAKALKQRGAIALLCSEGNPDECHRKLILNDSRLIGRRV